MTPAGHTHGRIAARILLFLAQYVHAGKLGAVYAAETGFLLHSAPDTVRAPDVAFVCAARLADLSAAAEGYFPGPPDLAVEVLSPSDTYTEVEEKVVEWLTAGARVVVVVDPRKQFASVYRSLRDISILTADEVLTVDELLPGWSVRVSDFFA